MHIPFKKFHGAGNDFVMIDNLAGLYPSLSEDFVQSVCDRHFGVGGDGLIVLVKNPSYDFEMLYYNADGRAGSLCGNGGRCAVQFAHSLGIRKEQYFFLASDGPHSAERFNDGRIRLKMNDCHWPRSFEKGFFIDTGSPHYVEFVEESENFSLLERALPIRHHAHFMPGGTNVNYILSKESPYEIRTFERGVEAETLACGTGATAVALVLAFEEESLEGKKAIKALGGSLEVEYRRAEKYFTDIYLTGPAEQVFEGFIPYK